MSPVRSAVQSILREGQKGKPACTIGYGRHSKEEEQPRPQSTTDSEQPTSSTYRPTKLFNARRKVSSNSRSKPVVLRQPRSDLLTLFHVLRTITMG